MTKPDFEPDFMTAMRNDNAMSTKREVLKMLEKIPDDEPLFLIRAQDKLSANVVTYWAKKAEKLGVNNDKRGRALWCLLAMIKWPVKKIPD